MPPKTRRGSRRGGQGRGKGRGTPTRTSTRKKVGQPAFIEIDSVESPEEDCIDDANHDIDASDLTVLDEVIDNSIEEQQETETEQALSETVTKNSVSKEDSPKADDESVTEADENVLVDNKDCSGLELEDDSEEGENGAGEDGKPEENNDDEESDNRNQQNSLKESEDHEESENIENDHAAHGDEDEVEAAGEVEEEEEEEEYEEEEIIEEEEVVEGEEEDEEDVEYIVEEEEFVEEEEQEAVEGEEQEMVEGEEQEVVEGDEQEVVEGEEQEVVEDEEEEIVEGEEEDVVEEEEAEGEDEEVVEEKEEEVVEHEVKSREKETVGDGLKKKQEYEEKKKEVTKKVEHCEKEFKLDCVNEAQKVKTNIPATLKDKEKTERSDVEQNVKSKKQAKLKDKGKNVSEDVKSNVQAEQQPKKDITLAENQEDPSDTKLGRNNKGEPDTGEEHTGLKHEHLDEIKEIITEGADEKKSQDGEQKLAEERVEVELAEEEEEEEEEIIEEEEEVIEEEEEEVLEEVEYVEEEEEEIVEEEEILEEEEEVLEEEEELVEGEEEVQEGDQKQEEVKKTAVETKIVDVVKDSSIKELDKGGLCKSIPVVVLEQLDSQVAKELNIKRKKNEDIQVVGTISKVAFEKKETSAVSEGITKETEEVIEEPDDEGVLEIVEEAIGDDLEEHEEYEEEYIEIEGDEEVEYEEVEFEEEEVEYEEYEEVEEEILEEEEEKEEIEAAETLNEAKKKQEEKVEEGKEDKENKKELDQGEKEEVKKEQMSKKEVRKILEQKVLKFLKENKTKEGIKSNDAMKKKTKVEPECVLLLESSDEDSEQKKSLTKDLKSKGPSTIEINIKTDSLEKLKPTAKKPLQKYKKFYPEKKKEKVSSPSPKTDKDEGTKKNESVKKNLNALEELMKSGDWKLMDETKEAEKDVQASKTFNFVKPFIKGVQEGRPAVFEMILGAKEPLLGLEYIVEVWKEDGKTAPRYFCALCIYLLTHEELLKHLNHVSHKGAYLNLHARECWNMFPRTQPSKWTHEYVVALEKVCQLMEENNMRRLNMLITSKRTYDMFLGRIHHQADSLPHYHLPSSWRQIFKELNLWDTLKADDSKEKTDPISSRPTGRDVGRFSSQKDKRVTPPRRKRSRTPEKRRQSRSRSRSPVKKSRYYSPYAKKRRSHSISPFRKVSRVKRSKSPVDLLRTSRKKFRSRSRSPRRRSRSRSHSRSRSRSPLGSYLRKRRSRSTSRPRRRNTRSRSRSRSPVRFSLAKRKEGFRIGDSHIETSFGVKTSFSPGTFKKTIQQSTTEIPKKTFNPLVSLSASTLEENIFKTLQNFMKPTNVPKQTSTRPQFTTSVPSSTSVISKSAQLYKQNVLSNPDNPDFYTSTASIVSYTDKVGKREMVGPKTELQSSKKIESLVSSNRNIKGNPRNINPNLRAIPESMNTATALPEKKKPSIASSLLAMKQRYSSDDREAFANPSRPESFSQEKSSNLLSVKTMGQPNVTFPAAHKMPAKTPMASTLIDMTTRPKAQLRSSASDRKNLIHYPITEETKKEFMDFMCKIQTAPKITPKAEEKPRAGIYATTKKTLQDAESWLKSLASGAQAACSNLADTAATKKGVPTKTKKSTNFWDSWMERHDEREEQPAPPPAPPAAKETLERKGYSVNAFENFKNITSANLPVKENRGLGYEKSYPRHYQQEASASSAPYTDPFGKAQRASSQGRSRVNPYDSNSPEDIDPDEWLYKQEQLAWGEQELADPYEEALSHSREQPQPHLHLSQVMMSAPPPAPAPPPQEDVSSVAEKLNSTLTRILKDYKPTGGLFNVSKQTEQNVPQQPVQDYTYQQPSHSDVTSAPAIPSNNVNLAGTIAATLTKMGLTNVSQDQLVNIVKNLGFAPSGSSDPNMVNRMTGNIMENMNTYEQQYQYQQF